MRLRSGRVAAFAFTLSLHAPAMPPRPALSQPNARLPRGSARRLPPPLWVPPPAGARISTPTAPPTGAPPAAVTLRTAPCPLRSSPLPPRSLRGPPNGVSLRSNQREKGKGTNHPISSQIRHSCHLSQGKEEEGKEEGKEDKAAKKGYGKGGRGEREGEEKHGEKDGANPSPPQDVVHHRVPDGINGMIVAVGDIVDPSTVLVPVVFFQGKFFVC